MSKLSRYIAYEDEVQAKIERGLEKVYKVAKAAYGPKAGNALLEQNYGDPLISRDGVTNIDKVYLSDAIENMAARIVVQASKKNNRKVGDGTTAVTILAYHLYKEARNMINSGMNRMAVSKLLEQTSTEAIDQIDSLKKPVNDRLLRHVAQVSAGDEAIGEMIADVIGEVGLDGGVTVEDFAGVGVYNELVDGFYFRKGFTNINLITDPANLESVHHNVDILISEKPLRTQTDIAPIMDKIVGNGGKELVIIGEVGEEALALLILNRIKGIITTTVADLPEFGSMRSLFLDDLAVITGGQVLHTGTNSTAFDLDMLGGADKVLVNEFSTTIIGSQGSKEDAEIRIKELHNQIKEAESEITTETLTKRLSQLTGKVAIVRVGGATEIEQGEVKLRVQDAICAVQAAIKDGVVPGGGVALLHLKPKAFSRAFTEPFKQLVDNAGLNSEEALWKALQAPAWHGFDLKSDKLQPVDLLKKGILDPADVIKEVIRNSTSVVSKLITAAVAISYKDREQKND